MLSITLTVACLNRTLTSPEAIQALAQRLGLPQPVQPGTIGEEQDPWHLLPLALQEYAVCVSTRVPVQDVRLKDLVA